MNPGFQGQLKLYEAMGCAVDSSSAFYKRYRLQMLTEKYPGELGSGRAELGTGRTGLELGWVLGAKLGTVGPVCPRNERRRPCQRWLALSITLGAAEP